MPRRDSNQTNTEELDVLEAHLAGTLRRGSPSNEMVQPLRGRIQLQMPSRDEIALRLTDWRRLLLIFGGVISGMMLIVTLARMFYYLVGRKEPI